MWPSSARSSRGTTLLEGREDERLVRQAMQHERFPRAGRAARASCTPRWPRRCAPAASTASGATRPRPSTPRSTRTTIVTTGTASGKSLCFQLPTLDVLSRDARPARCSSIRPRRSPRTRRARCTRSALSARGRRSTTATRRASSARDLRRRANVVLTNPDMLHLGILPNHPAWARLLQEPRGRRDRRGARLPRRLRLARGERAAAAAARVRDLRDVAALPAGERHRRQPRRAGHAADRASTTSRVISRDGSPGTKRTIAMWNPPVTDEATMARRVAAGRGRRPARLARDRGRADDRLHEVAQGGRADGALRGARARARRAPGARVADRALPRGLHGPAAAGARGAAGVGRAARRGRHRRAGARDRHRRARRGDLRDVPGDRRVAAADVGPRRAARARAGGLRGGRGRARPVLLPAPDEFLERPVEAAILDHENEQLYAAHLLCAAHEGAAGGRRTRESLGPRWRASRPCWSARATCASAGRHVRPAPPEGYPAGDFSLRSASRDGVAIVDLDDGEVIGDVDIGPAPSTVHQGAIYLHGGRQFEVSAFDFDDRRALVAAVRRALVHAGQARDRHPDRAGDRGA